LMIDLLDCEDELETLMKAIRVAVGRHHRVIVLCPWVEGMPYLDDRLDVKAKRRRVNASIRNLGLTGLAEQMHRDAADYFNAAYRRIRQKLAKSGVILLRADPDESVRLILNKLDQLRGAPTRR
jgi:hypothetical protein